MSTPTPGSYAGSPSTVVRACEGEGRGAEKERKSRKQGEDGQVAVRFSLPRPKSQCSKPTPTAIRRPCSSMATLVQPAAMPIPELGNDGSGPCSTSTRVEYMGFCSGHDRRFSRLIPDGRPAIWHPVDDALIAGPVDGFLAPTNHFSSELLKNLDAVLGFRGSLPLYGDLLLRTPTIMNLSASTTMNDHTRKVIVGVG